MKKFLMILFILAAGYTWYTQRPPGFTGDAHSRVIMYSLTTCGYCNEKRKDLTLAAIPFTEYFVDKDANRNSELIEKLRKAGFSTWYGTPTFDVHGYILLNNPAIPTIREYMETGQQKTTSDKAREYIRQSLDSWNKKMTDLLSCISKRSERQGLDCR